MMYIKIFCFGIVLGVASTPTLANETMRSLAMSGDWGAMVDRPTELAPPDVCMAINPRAHFLLRQGDDQFELRVADETWSLPAHATGKLRVQSGAYDKSFDSEVLDATLVGATIDTDLIPALLDALSGGDYAMVTVGKEAPRKVSLSGTSKVLNAFRTCAGIAGSSAGGGSNPFK